MALLIELRFILTVQRVSRPLRFRHVVDVQITVRRLRGGGSEVDECRGTIYLHKSFAA